MNKTVELCQTLDELKQICLSCQNCELGKTRQRVVFGEGPSDAEIFFLGEAPGAREDETGRPFVGRAGDLLTELFAKAGIDRQRVFITGSCKCRPPKNRNPRKPELNACRPFLERQLAIIKPKVVICSGLVAAHNILDPKARMADVRGRWFDQQHYRILPTYHPAAVLRGTVKAELLVEDFQQVAASLPNV
ncbi:MAG: uracil-DNA glycosylase [Clostridiales bacterium]|nr:uracil-DNA glycosylase [Clostridiales bacterium]